MAGSIGWIVVVKSDESLVFHLASALAGVATVAHGLERPVPKVAALCDREDVVHDARQPAALDAGGVHLEPCEAQLHPHLGRVPLISIDSMPWLAPVTVWRLPTAFGDVCHSCILQ